MRGRDQCYPLHRTNRTIPNYTVVNHDPLAPMPFFTFAPGPVVVVPAPSGDAGVPAGREVCMSYGARAAGELLMFQGFAPREAAEADDALVSARLPPACSPGSDPLFGLKVSVLEKLGVSWKRQGLEHFVGIAQARGEPPSVAAMHTPDAVKWALPLDFRVAPASGDARLAGLPPALLTLARVAVLTRGDAATALRATQTAIAAAEAAAAAGGGHADDEDEDEDDSDGGEEEDSEEDDSDDNEAAEGHNAHGHAHGADGACSGGEHAHGDDSSAHGHAHATAAAASDGGGSHGHSHGGQPCHGHGHGHGHGAAAAVPPPCLPFISDANEADAMALIRTWLAAAVAGCGGEAPDSESALEDAGGAVTEEAAAIALFVAQQRDTLRHALRCAQAE